MATTHQQPPHHDFPNAPQAGHRSLRLWPIAVAWFTTSMLLGWLGADAAAEVVFVAGLIVPWAGILAISALIRPPKPLSDVSILMQRLVWMIRACWAAVVIVASAMVSAMVAIEIQDRRGETDAWNAVMHDGLSGVVGPVAYVAAVLASSTVPIQLWRVGPEHCAEGIRAILKIAATVGIPARWAHQLLTDLVSPTTAVIVCYLGPVVLALAFAT